MLQIERRCSGILTQQAHVCRFVRYVTSSRGEINNVLSKSSTLANECTRFTSVKELGVKSNFFLSSSEYRSRPLRYPPDPRLKCSSNMLLNGTLVPISAIGRRGCFHALALAKVVDTLGNRSRPQLF